MVSVTSIYHSEYRKAAMILTLCTLGVGMIMANQTSMSSPPCPSIGTELIYHTIRSFGPFKGSQPDGECTINGASDLLVLLTNDLTGTYWAEKFPHTAWFDMSQYYITAFKTGSYPAITVSFVDPWLWYIVPNGICSINLHITDRCRLLLGSSSPCLSNGVRRSTSQA